MDTYGGSLTDPMSLHKYLFANSNPVMYCDPSGHASSLVEFTATITIQAIIGAELDTFLYVTSCLTGGTTPINDTDFVFGCIEHFLTGFLLGLAFAIINIVALAFTVTAIIYYAAMVVGGIYAIDKASEDIYSGNPYKQLRGVIELISGIIMIWIGGNGLLKAVSNLFDTNNFAKTTQEYNKKNYNDNETPNKASPKRPNRDQYMGRTPGKNSKTGRATIERMRSEGLIRDNNGVTEFYSIEGEDWFPLTEGDMAHKVDCVKFWNETGRYTGAKSKFIRQWMLNSNNFYIEHYHYNRSAGARLNETYLPPAI
jgi:hypothetical protein